MDKPLNMRTKISYSLSDSYTTNNRDNVCIFPQRKVAWKQPSLYLHRRPMQTGFPGFLLYLIMTATLVLLSSCQPDEQEEFEPAGRTLEYTTEISFLNSESEAVSSIEAAIADDEASRSAGLMDVQSMPMDNGMLFIFEDEQPRSFWMANTPLPLDILFVNEDFEIVRIHRNTQPYSDRSIQSEEPAKYVIETNAGYTLRNDIVEGMKVRF